jgi:hypothetical protein
VQRTRLRTTTFVILALLAIGGIAFAASNSVRFIVCSTVGLFTYGFPSESDRAKTQIIRDEIVRVHHFAHNSVSQPQEPPVFSNSGSNMLLRLPAKIWVYDVTDRAEQDKIATALKNLSAQRGFSPFKLCYYDHENWIVDGNLGARGPETQLRCLCITRNGIRDLSGQQIITYPVP